MDAKRIMFRLQIKVRSPLPWNRRVNALAIELSTPPEVKICSDIGRDVVLVAPLALHMPQRSHRFDFFDYDFFSLWAGSLNTSMEEDIVEILMSL